MIKNLGGWHRLYIFLAALYFILVAVICIDSYPKNMNEVSPNKILELMDNENRKYIVKATNYEPYNPEQLTIATPYGHFITFATDKDAPPPLLTKIEIFRKKYPQYNDLSDEDLANKLYSKFYSDMPRAYFERIIGVMPEMDRIKRNVAKMASMNAPEEDIDDYIASEGVTVDQVRNHRMGFGSRVSADYDSSLEQKEEGPWTKYQKASPGENSALKEIVREYIANMPIAMSAQRMEVVRNGFLAWLIPLAFLYAFARGINWVYRGFKR
jgi:hypothetical protein